MRMSDWSSDGCSSDLSPTSLLRLEIDGEYAQLLGGQHRVRRHTVVRLDRLAVADPAHQRAAIVGQDACTQGPARTDKGEVWSGKAVRACASDAIDRKSTRLNSSH